MRKAGVGFPSIATFEQVAWNRYRILLCTSPACSTWIWRAGSHDAECGYTNYVHQYWGDRIVRDYAVRRRQTGSKPIRRGKGLLQTLCSYTHT